jgi:hypothetical protein
MDEITDIKRNSRAFHRLTLNEEHHESKLSIKFLADGVTRTDYPSESSNFPVYYVPEIGSIAVILLDP